MTVSFKSLEQSNNCSPFWILYAYYVAHKSQSQIPTLSKWIHSTTLRHISFKVYLKPICQLKQIMCRSLLSYPHRYPVFSMPLTMDTVQSNYNTVVRIRILSFSVEMTCKRVSRYQCFGQINSLHLQAPKWQCWDVKRWRLIWSIQKRKLQMSTWRPWFCIVGSPAARSVLLHVTTVVLLMGVLLTATVSSSISF
jgi:hypothetical protein